MVNCLEDVYQIILSPECVLTCKPHSTALSQSIKDYELTTNGQNNSINVTINNYFMEVRAFRNSLNKISQYYERLPLTDSVCREKAQRMEKLLNAKAATMLKSK